MTTAAAAEATPDAYYALEDNAATNVVVDSINSYNGTSSSNTTLLHSTGTGCWSGDCFKFTSTAGRFYTANSNVLGYFTDNVFTVELTYYGDGSSTLSSGYSRLLEGVGATFRVQRYNSDTSLRVVTGTSNADFTVADLDDGNVQKIRVVVNTAESTDKIKVYQKVGTGGSWALKGSSANLGSISGLTSVNFYGDGSSPWYSATGTYKVDEVKIWNSAVIPQ